MPQKEREHHDFHFNQEVLNKEHGHSVGFYGISETTRTLRHEQLRYKRNIRIGPEGLVSCRGATAWVPNKVCVAIDASYHSKTDCGCI